MGERILIVVKGFDVSVPKGWTLGERVLRVESMLRNHFSSCGKIKSVCIPHVFRFSTMTRHAYIEILGENAKEKALKLRRSEMDGMKGHKLAVSLPLPPMRTIRREEMLNDQFFRCETMLVTGYDTSLPPNSVKSALRKHFSLCGEVIKVELEPEKQIPYSRFASEFVASSSGLGDRFAYVSIYGEGAKAKALQLCGSDMGGCKLVVEKSFSGMGDSPRVFPIGLLPSEAFSERVPDFPKRRKMMMMKIKNNN
jgi:RNA recognition motif-containing protein